MVHKMKVEQRKLCVYLGKPDDRERERERGGRVATSDVEGDVEQCPKGNNFANILNFAYTCERPLTS